MNNFSRLCSKRMTATAPDLAQTVAVALAEDLGGGDVTTAATDLFKLIGDLGGTQVSRQAQHTLFDMAVDLTSLAFQSSL